MKTLEDFEKALETLETTVFTAGFGSYAQMGIRMSLMDIRKIVEIHKQTVCRLEREVFQEIEKQKKEGT